MEETLRIRLVFDDRKILSKSQRSMGLNQSWLLLNSNIATISDLASHVCRIFKLKRSCPNDLLLSMDDFVLPPFESTCILKDKDIIRVRKKDGTHMDAMEFDANPHYIQYSGVPENGHTISSDKLLAIQEFEDDSGQRKREKAKDLCAHNETANHTGSPLKPKNKRKHSDEIRGSKKKKLKASSKKPSVSDKDEDTAEELVHLRNGLDSSKKKTCSLKSSNKKDKPSTSNKRPGTLVNSQRENNFDLVTSSAKKEKSGQKNLQLVSLENAIISTSIAGDIPAEQNQGSFLQTDNSAERLCKKDRQSDKDGKSDAVFASQHDDCKQPNYVLMEESTLFCSSVQAEDNIGGNACKPLGNESGTKVQSRSTRRKKAKRQWAREMKSQQAQNTQTQTPPDINHREVPEQQKTGQDTEIEKEIVPLVIRPGHIRFQSLDEEQGQSQSQTLETMETLQWKGTTSKKKGQKWGQEKGGSKWTEANGYEAQNNREENGGINCNKANGYKEQYNRKEKGGKQNNARDYKEQYNRNEKTVSRWNEQSNGQNFGNNANCHNEQYNGKLKIMSKVNDPICHDEQSNEKEKSTSKWNDANGCEKQCDTKANECIDANDSDDQSNRKAVSVKGKTGSGPIDFENSSNHSTSYSNQAPRKQPRKGDNPVRLPSTEVSVDSRCPSTWTCKNSACKAVLSTEDTFCKRCSCCICHLFDDNKDPSLWLVCSSESGGGDWCGWSCHIECALQRGKAGVVDHGQFMRLDGSYCCASCGKVSGIIGSWRKQLAIAKDARRVDVLCYRIFLSYRLLDGTSRFKELHKIVDDAKAKLEKEVGAVNGVSAKMARGIVSRLSVASDVQRLCTLAIEKADEWLNSNVNSDPEHGDSLPAACRFQFEEISSSSLVIVLKETSSSAASDSIKGYKLWYYKTRDEEPWKKEPVTFPRAQRRILISNLQPCTEYAFRIISFTEDGDLGHSEAKCFTKSVEIIPKHVESNGAEGCSSNAKREAKTPAARSSSGFKVRKLGKILQLAWAQEEDGCYDEFYKDEVDRESCGGSGVVKPETVEDHNQAELSVVVRRLDLNVVSVPDLNAEVTPPIEDENGCSSDKNELARSNGSGDSIGEVPAVESRPESRKRLANANEEICDGDSTLVNGSPLRFSNGFGQLDDNYEYCVKVIRWLECTGHIEKNFRMKFLTWFSLRSNEQERRVVITFIRTLVDEPSSLAGQLIDSFSEIVTCKRLRNGFCSKLWH